MKAKELLISDINDGSFDDFFFDYLVSQKLLDDSYSSVDDSELIKKFPVAYDYFKETLLRDSKLLSKYETVVKNKKVITDDEYITTIERLSSGIVYKKVCIKGGYVCFDRKYKLGYPVLEDKLEPKKIKLSGYTEPVYQLYGDEYIQKKGLIIKLEKDMFFQFSYTKNFLSEHKSYCKCESDISQKKYSVCDYKDGVFISKDFLRIDKILAKCPVVKKTFILELFYQLKMNLCINVKPVPCECSNKGLNGVSNDVNTFIKDLYFNGQHIYKVCRVCGAWELLS